VCFDNFFFFFFDKKSNKYFLGFCIIKQTNCFFTQLSMY
jgi:hypothetical protein